ncbi:hypothetical protein J1N35_037634 [Gossypium stocksii]|uniref:RRM domain-containing protein n=1 Tax=Gossypium stocksii TaxID=47602 RepID=A0A9D3ZM36_9ROSI|nr:hypothetical protein J1N35_037634 [Gossypium stocksii]
MKQLGERRSVETVFVYNILNSMHWKGLWVLFGYHGYVVDAFIQSKRYRIAKRIGFVRLSNEKVALRVIIRLNGFFLEKRIKVKMASYRSKRKSLRIGSDQNDKE